MYLFGCAEKVPFSLLQQVHTVPEKPQPRIAPVADDAADGPRLVVVVDVQATRPTVPTLPDLLLATNGTHVPLRRRHNLVVRERDPLQRLQDGVLLVVAGPPAHLRSAFFGVAPVAPPPLRDEFRATLRRLPHSLLALALYPSPARVAPRVLPVPPGPVRCERRKRVNHLALRAGFLGNVRRQVSPPGLDLRYCPVPSIPP